MIRAPLICVLIAASCAAPRTQRTPVGVSDAPLGVSDAEPAPPVSPQPDHDGHGESARMRFEELSVPEFAPAVVALPESRAPVPLVIAAHGAGGSAEWQCQHWATVVRGRAIVLCPRGKRISLRADYGWYYPNHFELEREFSAMVAAAKERYGARVRSGPGIYTGFSQGATMGALMIIEHGAAFPYVLLIEGAAREFSLSRARTFQRSGGKRVAFVCGVRGCARGTAKMAALLQRAGLEAQAEYVEGGGHTDDGPVGERAAEIFESMLDELERL